jgi:hypothetical protein
MQISSVSSTTEAAVQEASLVAIYSTTVGGKSYSADVEQSGDEYTVTVSGLAGASASGSSIVAAEESIQNQIDILA